MNYIIQIAATLLFGALILQHFKNQIRIMEQNDTLLAIAAELQASNTSIAGSLQTIITDIQAANTASTPVPQSTIDALQSAADGIKASADAIGVALAPPATDNPA